MTENELNSQLRFRDWSIDNSWPATDDFLQCLLVLFDFFNESLWSFIMLCNSVIYSFGLFAYNTARPRVWVFQLIFTHNEYLIIFDMYALVPVISTGIIIQRNNLPRWSNHVWCDILIAYRFSDVHTWFKSGITWQQATLSVACIASISTPLQWTKLRSTVDAGKRGAIEPNKKSSIPWTWHNCKGLKTSQSQRLNISLFKRPCI